jgi:hypothetical protein
VDEAVGELKTEELVPTAETGETLPAPAVAPEKRVFIGWLRLAYMFEFLLALNVAYGLWSEIGGQGHLDLLPWYTKLICGVGLSWSVVQFTSGMVETEHFWNQRSRRWFVIIVLFVTAMGGIVYYYHLHEVPEESGSEDSSATSLQQSHPDSVNQKI